MAVSSFIKNNTHGAITLSDGTGTPVTLAVAYDNGDFAISGLTETLREYTKYETRGTFNSAAHTVRKYPTGSFSVKVSQFTDATAGTVLDFLLKTGNFSSNASTIAGDVYAIDIDFDMEGTDFSDSADHSIAITDAIITDASFAEGDPNTVSVSFEVVGTVTFS